LTAVAPIQVHSYASLQVDRLLQLYKLPAHQSGSSFNPLVGCSFTVSVVSVVVVSSISVVPVSARDADEACGAGAGPVVLGYTVDVLLAGVVPVGSSDTVPDVLEPREVVICRSSTVAVPSRSVLGERDGDEHSELEIDALHG